MRAKLTYNPKDMNIGSPLLDNVGISAIFKEFNCNYIAQINCID